ncbi:MAG: Fe-S-cluster-containing hydrogenase [Bdellovibrionia bacterium]
MSPLKDQNLLWKSLSEWEAKSGINEDNDPRLFEALSEVLTREFPEGASRWAELEDPVSRRKFIQIMGASMALAGLTACTVMPPEKIIPYIIQPENLVPGIPKYFATAYHLGGFAKGVLAESHEGRPTKLEGNPKHPSTLGKSDIFMQAELLQLYDPDRAKTVTHLGSIKTWDEFTSTMLLAASQWKTSQGEGVIVLTHPITSPTLIEDIRSFLHLYPKAKWSSYDPLSGGQLQTATTAAFGQKLSPLYDFTQAQVVLSLDADFLGPGPAQETYSRDFMSFRKKRDQKNSFNRLYVAESSISITGACADNRWPVRPSVIPELARSLAGILGVKGIAPPPPTTEIPSWLKIAAQDLKTHAGHSLVLIGEQNSAEVQILVFAINEHLGNFGKTLSFIEPLLGEAHPPQHLTVEGLTHEMAAGKVKAIFILGGNPVYDTPATLRFKDHLDQVPLRIISGIYRNETSYLCHWFLPESHFLETWGDGRSFEGTITFQQPLISPLYETRSILEVFSILTNRAGRTAGQALREYWEPHRPPSSLNLSFEEFFEHALRDGFIANSASRAINVSITQALHKTLGSSLKFKNSEANGDIAHPIEAVFKPDPTIWDGRYANNAWLQELPKPILQLTWGNAVILSPATAKLLDLKDEDQVELKIADRIQHASILRVPGHPDHCATLYLGYGRTRAGRVGSKTVLGYNAYALQDHSSPTFAREIHIRKLGKTSELATTHMHSSMEGRDIVIYSDYESWRRKPNSIINEELKKEQPTILADFKYPGEAWAMVIDLTVCIGCKACTIACQAENNIPVVGKEEVRRSREMHWIRVDRYFQGNASNPRVFFQPVPCMHCEKAPCEVVCPTVATNHSYDGLNQMIYNRCVGTRYCSNNCPYKVRRFNFFQYSDTKDFTSKLRHNPDVTVRSRGVMEKCTYCTQRIQGARINAEIENRPIRDQEILTACQQACPTDAIIFGDQNNKKSQVAHLKGLPENYKLLNDLGTKPRTTYLALIRNPNAQIHLEETE